MNQRTTIDIKSIIERQLAILLGIVTGLIAMSGLTPGAATLPRHLRNAVCRLLRPAESIARRLVFAAARDLTVTLPPPRPKRLSVEAHHAHLRSLGIAVAMRPADLARYNAAMRRKAERAAAGASQPHYCLPLVERLPWTGPPRRKTASRRCVPRVLSLEHDAPRPAPIAPPPRPSDQVSAGRLGLRLHALANLREDMPKLTRRLARWNARRKAGLIRRSSPLKPGRPPGSPPWNAPKNRQQPVHDLLREAQWLAYEAAKPADTS